MLQVNFIFFFFFFNDTATTEIYTLSLHDALPIYYLAQPQPAQQQARIEVHIALAYFNSSSTDRKSTRLNSSHLVISYAVFCLKKKKPLQTRVDHLHHSSHPHVTSPATLGIHPDVV